MGMLASMNTVSIQEGDLTGCEESYTKQGGVPVLPMPISAFAVSSSRAAPFPAFLGAALTLTLALLRPSFRRGANTTRHGVFELAQNRQSDLVHTLLPLHNQSHHHRHPQYN